LHLKHSCRAGWIQLNILRLPRGVAGAVGFNVNFPAYAVGHMKDPYEAGLDAVTFHLERLTIEALSLPEPDAERSAEFKANVLRQLEIMERMGQAAKRRMG
jgi:hypothetical protein